MIEKDNCVHVGQCIRAHGVNGEIVARANAGFLADDLCYEFLLLELDGGLVPFYVEDVRTKNNDEVLVKFEGIDTQDSARRLSDIDIYIERAWQEDVPHEEISEGYLIKFEAVDEIHGTIGTIVDIDDSVVSNPLFIIENANGDEILIPMNKDFIKSVDNSEKRVIFDLPEGLLTL